MRAGTLRHLLIIEYPEETRNQYGEPIVEWLPLAVVYGSKEDLAGREYYAAQGLSSEVTTRFRIRYRDDVTTKMRVLTGGVEYDIQAVQDPDGRKRETVLMASRI